MPFDIDEATKRLLNGCVVTAYDGTRLYTPDGKGNYRALWTRDFAYMCHGAGDIIPRADMIAMIDYLIRGADRDGWIPDRVEPDGKAIYTAGDEHFPAKRNLDTGPYLVLAASECLNAMERGAAEGQYAQWRGALWGGIDCLPVNEDGVIVNDTDPPHSPYGFTDCVAKTGCLSMETLILYEALGALEKWDARIGLDGARAAAWRRRIEGAFSVLFVDEKSGLILSATGVCRQRDLWASCYALQLNFPLERGVRDGILDYLTDHYDEIVQRGQLRHLPAGEYWQALFVPVERGVYQNGAFWATPIEWLTAALMKRDRALAESNLRALFDDFEARGIYECVNGDLLRLDTYVVSATNARAALKLLS